MHRLDATGSVAGWVVVVAGWLEGGRDGCMLSISSVCVCVRARCEMGRRQGGSQSVSHGGLGCQHKGTECTLDQVASVKGGGGRVGNMGSCTEGTHPLTHSLTPGQAWRAGWPACRRTHTQRLARRPDRLCNRHDHSLWGHSRHGLRPAIMGCERRRNGSASNSTDHALTTCGAGREAGTWPASQHCMSVCLGRWVHAKWPV